jgi:DNA (cytosine-5)-methyltransferase 1
MRYLSVCSGIEAATAAWHPLGWEPAGFAEIEPFPAAVLTQRYPKVRNHGDFTRIGDAGPIDLLVGGTPCQSFSVAGKRLGLDDPRGNLAVEFLRLARRLRPRWLVFENVPGVLSANGGRDFSTFLGLLVECGYGFAYRVLDAQHVRVDGFPRAVPQRRRRVFVVGHPDWRRAAAVLFEPEGMRGDPAPRREAGEGAARPIAPSLGASGRGFERTGEPRGQDCLVARSLNSDPSRSDGESETFVAHALRADGFAQQWAVRRLTPVECERLQGFPDGYTGIRFKGKPAADGPRYKALGNSMAVNVMRWIGRRIAMLEGAASQPREKN